MAPDKPANPTRGRGTQPAGWPPTLELQGNPDTDPEAARRVYILGVAATVYANGLANRIGDRLIGVNLAQSANTYAEDVLARMAPRDPAEEMLVAELIATHTGATHLADLAIAQTERDQIRILNEYADRAATTTRRTILALAEYRRPPRAGTTHFT